MLTTTTRVAAAAICLAITSGTALADEQMEQIFEAVAPYMHHSCANAIAASGEDEEGVAEIVRHMAMISLYNRQIDVLAEIPNEDDLERLNVEFVEELEDACEDDPGQLLAAAVDDAVRDTIETFD